MERLRVFSRTSDNPSTRIDQTITAERNIIVEKNRRFLSSIMKAIIFLGRQGLAFRGNNESGNLFDDELSLNTGNFRATLQLMCESDINLREHLETCSRNASYISKTTQNDLLACIRDFIQEHIVREVRNQRVGDFYSLIADEVTDCSNWEQLGIVLRYSVDDKPVEKLLAFIPCERITGEAIASKIVGCVQDVGLDPQKCRSQTYDGAGNMAGKQRGAARMFQLKTGNDKAVYVHCQSHELNLALSKACKVGLIILSLIVTCIFMMTTRYYFRFQKFTTRCASCKAWACSS